jgi:hypothetical protein
MNKDYKFQNFHEDKYLIGCDAFCLVEIYQRFGGTYIFNFKIFRVEGYLHPEDGGSISPKNRWQIPIKPYNIIS